MVLKTEKQIHKSFKFPVMAKQIKKKKYMLVEIAWDLKDIKAAAGQLNVKPAKFAQIQVKNAVERFKTKQLALI